MRRPFRSLLAYAPYAVVSAVHVGATLVDHAIAPPTKLLLMPALAAGVVWTAVRSGLVRRASARDGRVQDGHQPGRPAQDRPVRNPPMRNRLARPGSPASAVLPAAVAVSLLLVSLVCSWLGDGSSTFFPMFDDELPMMLLCFGLAHVAYLLLMWRAWGVAVRRLPKWSLVYAAAYLVLIAVLVPHTGALTIPVMVYGLLLVGTAAMSSRCGPVIAAGGAWFLLSDSILAFRVFLPQAMPAWSSGAVMLAYTIGQGLIAGGIVFALARRES